MNHVHSVTVVEAYDVLSAKTGVALLDVRSPAEYRGQHAKNAINLPLDAIKPAEVRRVTSDASEIYVICQGGSRSMNACQKLIQAGMDTKSLINVTGGTNAWIEADLPITTAKGQGTISIERQVRIGAGLMVFIGVVLGALVHPLWLILPGFVGAG